MENTNTNQKTSNFGERDLEQIRIAIQREFLSRCKKNPSYSLRAFASFLEVDQSFLSKLLKGERRVTVKLAASLGPKLGLKPSQIKEFITSRNRMPEFFSISDDEFEVISEWHHFAILELAKTKTFDPNPQSIANRLGLHITEVRDALKRLERLGLIEQTPKGLKLCSPNNTWTNTTASTAARRQLQKALLKQSLEAIDEVPFALRENGSLTVAINTKRLPEFKEKLKQVRRELSEFLQADGETNLDEVYQMTISLFPVSKIQTGVKK